MARCWARARRSRPGQRRLQVELEDAYPASSHWADHPAGQKADEGFFGIGVVRAKSAENHGTIWRSAYQLGASFTYTIGARFTRQVADTTESWKDVPALHFDSFDQFLHCRCRLRRLPHGHKVGRIAL